MGGGRGQLAFGEAAFDEGTRRTEQRERKQTREWEPRALLPLPGKARVPPPRVFSGRFLRVEPGVSVIVCAESRYASFPLPA